jgi:hypothetical protein
VVLPCLAVECCDPILVTFCNILVFYGEEFLAPHPAPKLKDHPWSVVCICSFNIFKAILHIWRLSVTFIHSLRTYYAVVARDDQIKENVMFRTCSMHRRDEKCLQQFSQET